MPEPRRNLLFPLLLAATVAAAAGGIWAARALMPHPEPRLQKPLAGERGSDADHIRILSATLVEMERVVGDADAGLVPENAGIAQFRADIPVVRAQLARKQAKAVERKDALRLAK